MGSVGGGGGIGDVHGVPGGGARRPPRRAPHWATASRRARTDCAAGPRRRSRLCGRRRLTGRAARRLTAVLIAPADDPAMPPITAPGRESLPLPRQWGVRPADVAALLAGNAVLIVAMWVRHGGLDQLSTLGGILTAIGQLTALLGTYLALVQLVLMSRSPWLDQAFGMDRLAWCAPLARVRDGVADRGPRRVHDDRLRARRRRNVVAEAVTILGDLPVRPVAVAAFALFVLVGVTSVRAARRRLSYETWYGLHLYAYLAIALASCTSCSSAPTSSTTRSRPATGSGCTSSRRAGRRRSGSASRSGPRGGTAPRRRVVPRRRTSSRSTSRAATSSACRALRPVLRVRFLTRDGWWRAHPFSISLRAERRLAPDHRQGARRRQRALRRAVGRHAGLRGGPVRDPDRRPAHAAQVTLIAGGIGIAPLRALLESLPGRPRRPHPPVPGEPPARRRVPRRARPARRAPRRPDPLSRRAPWRRARSDARATPWARTTSAGSSRTSRTHDVFLCGPTGLMQAVERDPARRSASRGGTSTPSGSPTDRRTQMPKRGVIALGLTALALVLLDQLPDAGRRHRVPASGPATSGSTRPAPPDDRRAVRTARTAGPGTGSGLRHGSGAKTSTGRRRHALRRRCRSRSRSSVRKVTDVVAAPAARRATGGRPRSAAASSPCSAARRCPRRAPRSTASPARRTRARLRRVAPGGARRRRAVTEPVIAEARRQLRVEPVMGTVVTIDVREPFVPDAALDEAIAWFHDVDRRFRPFREDSEVTRVGDGRPARSTTQPTDVPRDVHARRRGPRAVRRCLRPARPSGRTAVPIRRAWSRAGRSTRRSRCCGWPGPQPPGGRGRGPGAVGEPAPGGPWRIGIRHPDDAAAVAGSAARSATWPSRRPGSTSAASTSVDGRDGPGATGLRSDDGGRPDALRSRTRYATAAFAMGEAGHRLGGAAAGLRRRRHHRRGPGRVDAARRRAARRTRDCLTAALSAISGARRRSLPQSTRLRIPGARSPMTFNDRPDSGADADRPIFVSPTEPTPPPPGATPPPADRGHAATMPTWAPPGAPIPPRAAGRRSRHVAAHRVRPSPARPRRDAADAGATAASARSLAAAVLSAHLAAGGTVAAITAARAPAPPASSSTIGAAKTRARRRVQNRRPHRGHRGGPEVRRHDHRERHVGRAASRRSAQTASGIGSGIVIYGRRLHPHQPPRRRGRPDAERRAPGRHDLRRTLIEQCDRQRPRPDQGRRDRPDRRQDRRLGRDPDRPDDARHRQPARHLHRDRHPRASCPAIGRTSPSRTSRPAARRRSTA